MKKREKIFFFAAAEAKSTLKILFEPDLMNYASLGNRFRRLHVHLIPRYDAKREIFNVIFTDTRWGKNYAPYDKDFFISQQCLHEIKNLIKNTLNGVYYV